MMKNSIGSIIFFVAIVLGTYGYVNNIVRIWECETSTCRTVRVMGALFTVPGAVMGFIDFD